MKKIEPQQVLQHALVLGKAWQAHDGLTNGHCSRPGFWHVELSQLLPNQDVRRASSRRSGRHHEAQRAHHDQSAQLHRPAPTRLLLLPTRGLLATVWLAKAGAPVNEKGTGGSTPAAASATTSATSSADRRRRWRRLVRSYGRAPPFTGCGQAKRGPQSSRIAQSGLTTRGSCFESLSLVTGLTDHCYIRQVRINPVCL